MSINIAISKDGVKAVVQSLSAALADTYVLYVKTQNFHWNLIDPRFYSLHKMMQEQYEALALAVDEIAERIRMLGEIAPGSMQEFLKLTSLKECVRKLNCDEMLKELLHDNETIVRNLRNHIHQALEMKDDGSADMMIEFLRYHEKTSWMLRSHFIAH
jgi:starvation-inducible DNA-binding protein